jgi:micrococcal nuclease
MKKWLIYSSMLLILTACEQQQIESTETSGTTKQIPVELVDVIDGDTIKVKYNGKTETIRYLLLDTPEVRHQTLGNQPGGDEASARHKEIMENGQVSIEFDVGDRMDDYDRLLAYVYIDGESVQEILLKEGLGRVAYVFPPNTRYLDEFEEAQEIAKEAKKGIWEVENYATERGFNQAVFEENNKCLIKGNINREGNKIYHVPDSSSYIQTNPEEWFCSEKDAQDAGFRKAGR